MTQKANEVAKTTTTAVARPSVPLVDEVLAKVNQFVDAGDLVLPKDYNPGNALRSAWLVLQDMQVNGKPVLEICTKASIANALLSVVTQGMNVTKKQIYFIPYGDKLQAQRSYFGDMLIAKRDAGVKEIHAEVLYEGDVETFKYEVDMTTGRRRITNYEPQLKNIDPNKIFGAFSVIVFHDNSSDVVIMTMDEIRRSWKKSKSTNVQQDFPGEMAKRTVTRRALKLLINSSADLGAFDEDDEQPDPAAASVKTTLATKANTEVVDFAEAEVVNEPPATTTAATASTTAEPAPAATGQSDLFAGNQEGPGF